jgi:hypothetical protein
VAVLRAALAWAAIARHCALAARLARWLEAAEASTRLSLSCSTQTPTASQLVPLRTGRMAASPFAFYRGAAALMAAQHARLSESDAGRLAIAAARAYRETMADYSSMRVLDVWYDRILESNFTEEAESADVKRKVRRQLDENIGEGRRKSVPDHLFPKLRTTGRS